MLTILLSLHIFNSFPLSHSCFCADPNKSPSFPPLPPQGNCQTQPVGPGLPAAAVSHHCSTASPPGCLSKTAGKIDVLSSSAWERKEGIKSTGMLRGFSQSGTQGKERRQDIHQYYPEGNASKTSVVSFIHTHLLPLVEGYSVPCSSHYTHGYVCCCGSSEKTWHSVGWFF